MGHIGGNVAWLHCSNYSLTAGSCTVCSLLHHSTECLCQRDNIALRNCREQVSGGAQIKGTFLYSGCIFYFSALSVNMNASIRWCFPVRDTHWSISFTRSLCMAGAKILFFFFLFSFYLHTLSGRCGARWRSPSMSWQSFWETSWQPLIWCPSSMVSSKTWTKSASVCSNTSMTSSRWDYGDNWTFEFTAPVRCGCSVFQLLWFPVK